MSSAIASNLAKGYDLQTAVKRSKQYISGALAAMLDLGKGSGPMDHGFANRNEYVKESVKSEKLWKTIKRKASEWFWKVEVCGDCIQPEFWMS